MEISNATSWKNRPPWKTDHHPRRQHGWKNWWEVELNDGPNKTAEKEAAKKEIKEELENESD